MTRKVDGGTDIVMIISIVAGGIVVVIISILIVVCVNTHKTHQLHEASFDNSLCEYCTICSGEI